MGILGSLDFGQPLDLKTKTIFMRGHCAQEVRGSHGTGPVDICFAPQRPLRLREVRQLAPSHSAKESHNQDPNPHS